jgi:Raf kinase inhibitor-like YbhB/YbcL family protein
MKGKIMKIIAITVASLMLAASAQAAEFKVTSPDFADGKLRDAQFSDGFGCTGDNISPALHWSGVPEGTRSFVVTLYDKDAPTGSGFWHWVVVDIPADATGLAAGAGRDVATLPKGARMSANDASQPNFLGACPPPGETHDYTITVKALKVETLPVPENATAALIGFVSNMNTLATATISASGSQ